MGERAGAALSDCPVSARANTGAFVKKKFTPGWKVSAEAIVLLDTGATLRSDIGKGKRGSLIALASNTQLSGVPVNILKLEKGHFA